MKPLSVIAIRGGSEGARLVEICGTARRPQPHLQTPAAILYTKGASVPHITKEVFDMITKDDYMYQVPLVTSVHMKPGIDAQGKGIGVFAGLGDSPVFMTFQDPSVVVPKAQLEKFNMPLWSRVGKKPFDADLYMDYVESFKPDLYHVLSDGCTDSESAKKRIIKAVDRSKSMFERCLERHKASDYLMNNSSILGVIQGGYSSKHRIESVDSLLPEVDHLSGFMLDGFDCNGPNIENITYDSIKDIVETVTEKLPSDKFRLIQGCWNAVTLIDLILAGWDLFDSSMPFMATERHSAITFSLNANDDASDPYEINLEDEIYKEDFTPISKSCKCLACSKYTKAYINHLLNTKEMLGQVLLMIHNLHHYTELFKNIRQCIESNTLKNLRDAIAKQHIGHLNKMAATESKRKEDDGAQKKIRRL